MVVFRENLRCHVQKCTYHSEHPNFRLKLTRRPKVDQLHVEVLIDANILGLYIPVTYVLHVAIADCLQKLFGHFLGIVF